MPQPYRGTGSLFFAGSTMQERAALAAHIASVASLWTFTEEAWAYILGQMLGFEATAGLSIYHALTGTGAQRAVLNSIADQYLPIEFRDDFAALMKTSRVRAIERNTVVHGMWFVDPNIPEALVLAPRNIISSIMAKMMRPALEAKLAGLALPAAPGGNYGPWFVYKAKDFIAIERRIEAFFRQQDALIDKLHARIGIPGHGLPMLRPEAQSES